MLCLLFSIRNIIPLRLYHLGHLAISLKCKIPQMEKLMREKQDYILLEFLIVYPIFIFILMKIFTCFNFLTLLNFTIYPLLFLKFLHPNFTSHFNILFVIIFLKFNHPIFFLLVYFFNIKNEINSCLNK